MLRLRSLCFFRIGIAHTAGWLLDSFEIARILQALPSLCEAKLAQETAGRAHTSICDAVLTSNTVVRDFRSSCGSASSASIARRRPVVTRPIVVPPLVLSLSQERQALVAQFVSSPLSSRAPRSGFVGKGRGEGQRGARRRLPFVGRRASAVSSNRCRRCGARGLATSRSL